MSTAGKPKAPGPGRPKGSRTRVLRDEQALGRHHFAFLRAWLQGLDVKAAWLRYLAFAEDSDDLRYIERRRRELLARVLYEAADTEGLPPNRKPTGWSAGTAVEAQRLLTQVDSIEAARSLPSLEDFIAQQGLDPDQYSQAEWMEEYQAHYGLNQPAGDGAWGAGQATPALRQAQLQALRRLEHGLARLPLATDALARWFSPVTLPLLTKAGAHTLGEMLDLIDHRGPTWFRPIRGLGARRAGAIVAWLTPLAESWGRPQAVVPHRSTVAALGGSAGQAGRFSRPQLDNPALVGDLTVVHQWLKRHEATPATHRAYTKETERFCLWCIHVAHKPVPSIDTNDCQAYRQFLTEVPADWIEPIALPRAHPAWKPFRGPLKPASQRHALVVVQALFDALRDGKAVGANPMAEARSQGAPAEPAVLVSRSFSDPDWAFLLAQIDRAEAAALVRPPGHSALPAGALQRRLRLVLCLLRSTGLRLSELIAAHTGDLRSLAQPAASAHAGLITIHGPGPKQRALPLPHEVLAMVVAHHADATALGALPHPAPLICTLRPALDRGRASGTAGDCPAPASVRAGAFADDRRLGANGLYRMLKRFFARAGVQGRAIDASMGARISAASTHWLRHTFGEQGLGRGLPLATVQQALGHASAGTTRRYRMTAAGRQEPGAIDQEKGEGVGPSNPLPAP